MATEIILAALLAVAVIGIVYLLLTRQRAPTIPAPVLDPRIEGAINSLPQLQQELGGLRAAVQKLPSTDAVAAIETRLSHLEALVDQRVPLTLPTDLQQLDKAIQSIKGEYEPGKRIEDIHEATKRLMTLLAGGLARGSAGEFILAEAFRQLPPEMLDRDFKVDGRQVEFALVLSNGKRLPIDSKWPASDLVEKWEKATEPEAQQRLMAEVEKTVIQRANEVAKYLNPAVTTEIGIAAVPDAAYRACRKAHVQAYKDYNVLVVPYSMAAPYVLAFYNLHLKFGQAIELSNLRAYLEVIEKEVRNIDNDLEGRVKEAGTRANNAYENIKAALAKIRAASEYLRSAPEQASAAGNAAVEHSAADKLESI